MAELPCPKSPSKSRNHKWKVDPVTKEIICEYCLANKASQKLELYES
jgi:hypothetical protein